MSHIEHFRGLQPDWTANYVNSGLCPVCDGSNPAHPFNSGGFGAEEFRAVALRSSTGTMELMHVIHWAAADVFAVGVGEAALAHPAAPDSYRLKHGFQDRLGYDFLWTSAADLGSRRMTIEAMAEALHYGDPCQRAVAAFNNEIPEWMLDWTLDDPSELVRGAAAGNKQASPALLEFLSRDPSPFVYFNVAVNEHAPLSARTTVARHADLSLDEVWADGWLSVSLDHGFTSDYDHPVTKALHPLEGDDLDSYVTALYTNPTLTECIRDTCNCIYDAELSETPSPELASVRLLAAAMSG